MGLLSGCVSVFPGSPTVAKPVNVDAVDGDGMGSANAETVQRGVTCEMRDKLCGGNIRTKHFSKVAHAQNNGRRAA